MQRSSLYTIVLRRMRFAFYTLSIFAAVLLLSALPASADTTSQVICGSVVVQVIGNVAFTSAASGTEEAPSLPGDRHHHLQWLPSAGGPNAHRAYGSSHGRRDNPLELK